MVGRERGARGVCLLSLHQRAAPHPRPAAPSLGAGGAGLQQRAAALPKGRLGDGTSRACPALREQPSGHRAEELLLLGAEAAALTWEAGQVSVPEVGFAGGVFVRWLWSQALALWAPCCGGRWWLSVCPPPTTLTARLWDVSLLLGPCQGPAGTCLSSPRVPGGCGTAGEQRAVSLCFS